MESNEPESIIRCRLFINPRRVYEWTGTEVSANSTPFEAFQRIETALKEEGLLKVVRLTPMPSSYIFENKYGQADYSRLMSTKFSGFDMIEWKRNDIYPFKSGLIYYAAITVYSEER